MRPQAPRNFYSIGLLPVLLVLSIHTVTRANQPPAANPDHYTVHGNTSIPANAPPYGVLNNDSDPDGDPISCTFENVGTSLGTVLVFSDGSVFFSAAYGKTGTVN